MTDLMQKFSDSLTRDTQILALMVMYTDVQGKTMLVCTW